MLENLRGKLHLPDVTGAILKPSPKVLDAALRARATAEKEAKREHRLNRRTAAQEKWLKVDRLNYVHTHSVELRYLHTAIQLFLQEAEEATNLKDAFQKIDKRSEVKTCCTKADIATQNALVCAGALRLATEGLDITFGKPGQQVGKKTGSGKGKIITYLGIYDKRNQDEAGQNIQIIPPTFEGPECHLDPKHTKEMGLKFAKTYGTAIKPPQEPR